MTLRRMTIDLVEVSPRLLNILHQFSSRDCGVSKFWQVHRHKSLTKLLNVVDTLPEDGW